MRRVLIKPLVLFLCLQVFGASQVMAQVTPTSTVPAEIGPEIYNNWNKAGCGLTETIRFSLAEEHEIGLVQTWIQWPEGLQEMPYALWQNGAALIQGNFGRNSCDSYQQSWCQGVATWNTPLPAGNYAITTGLGLVCQNGQSDGNGFLALYQAAEGARSSASGGDTSSPQGQGPTVGDFANRQGPFSSDESTVGDYTSVFATTQGIVEYRPSGVVIASGNALPGDVDVVLFGLGEDGGVSLTLRPCSRTARVELFAIDGTKLAESGDISNGYYGLYNTTEVSGLTKGAYAFAVSYPEGDTCDDGKNGWVVDVGGHVVDPIEFVGPFEEKPDFSVREDLDVSDLEADILKILESN